ncbi:hypothetical protein [Ewingella americana]|uniref:hypothetical protein n=1 Tax=Ewingella americana TaxID=41202 RepID=UPI00163980F0|nr:hypothetical protein [Ewingella americana]QMV54064.1 hypothetical protein GXP68_22625 [Ewingella americana]
MLSPNNDFSEVIRVLHKNAKMSNMISIIMTYFMVVILLFSVVGIVHFQKQNDVSNPIFQLFERVFKSDADNKVVNKENASSLDYEFDNKSDQAKGDVRKFIESINSTTIKLQKLEEAIDHPSLANGVSNSITKVVLTLTLAFFVIYIVKISIIFIKYYSQLASHYNSLAAAFIASNGDFDKAVKLVKVLSISHITMGKAPDTVHEAALKNLAKVITQVARKD